MTPNPHLTIRYQVHELIGEGGVGQVFRAWDTELKRWVALKRLSVQENSTSPDQAQIVPEVSILSSLQHPNIVMTHDFGTDETGPFIVMELLEGENLKQVTARGALSFTEFCTLVEQVLSGVGVAHQAGLIHADLKPDNLMLVRLPTNTFQVKILDFGLARFGPSFHEPIKEKMMGSIFTMAPEQFNRQPLDARTDLYALGCIFYYVLVGQYPFRGETTQDVMIAHLQHHVTFIEQLRDDLPPALCHWVMRLISVEPSHRYGSAAEALQVFNDIVSPEN